MVKKAALAVAGLLVLALLAAPLLLKALLPPERVRALVVAGARKSLHREVKLGGASLGLRGLTLEDLSVSEPPDFNAGTFGSVKSFSLRVKLWPLLRKRVVVDAVAADGLSLRVVKTRAGAYNFSDLLAGGSSAPEEAAAKPGAKSGAAPAGSAPVEVKIRNLRLEGARLSYEEEGAPRRVTLSEVATSVSGFALNGTFSAQLSGKAKGVWDARMLDGAAKFDGKVDLGGQDPAKLAVSAKTLEVSAAGWTARVAGSAKDLRKPALDVTFKLSGPPGAVASGGFKGTVTPPSGGGGAAADGAASLKTAELSAKDAASLAALLPLPAGMPVPAVSASADFAYGGDALALKRLEAQTPWGPLKASGRVSGLSRPKSDVDLEAEGDLKVPALRAADAPWLKLPAGVVALPPVRVSGKARVKNDAFTTPGLTLKGAFGFLEIAGSARRPAKAGARPDADLSLSMKLDLPQLKAADLAWASVPAGFVLPPMEVVGEGRFKGDDLSLSPLRVKGKAGTLEASGSVRGVTSGEPEPNLDVTMKLSLPPLKSADDPFGKVPPGLSLPASTWDGSLTASRDEVKIRSLRAVLGRNDFSVDNGRVTGLRGGAPFVNLVVKCKQFELSDITSLSQTLKELDLKGSGYFALGATGKLPRPVLEGKAQFKGVGANVQGLKLADFTGTASFNETSIDVPNLRGKVADGELSLNLTAKNYAKAPDIEVEASLDTFDLGSFLAAKQGLNDKKEAKVAAHGLPEPPADAQPKPPVSTRGKLTVGRLIHPNLQAQELRLDWDLTGVSADLSRLGGKAKASSKAGQFSNLDSAGKQYKIFKFVRVLKTVVLLAMRINADNPPYADFAGDYAFSGGVMEIKQSHVVLSDHDMDMKGTIDLPKESLNLTVIMQQVLGSVPIEVGVTGTLDSPNVKVKVAKAIQEGIKEGLKQGAGQLLKGLLPH